MVADREVRVDGFHYIPDFGIFHKGRKLRLTNSQVRVFAALISSPGRVLTKEGIVSFLDTEADTKIIDVYVCRIRKVLLAELNVEAIHTVWGRGYLWRLPPTD